MTLRRDRRRGVCTTARRFSCQYSGCSKSYSRAEHLQRHELNHNPKEIFICDISGCRQRFVRKDLLDRHHERHASGAMVASARVEQLPLGTESPANAPDASKSLQPSALVWPPSTATGVTLENNLHLEFDLEQQQSTSGLLLDETSNATASNLLQVRQQQIHSTPLGLLQSSETNHAQPDANIATTNTVEGSRQNAPNQAPLLTPEALQEQRRELLTESQTVEYGTGGWGQLDNHVTTATKENSPNIDGTLRNQDMFTLMDDGADYEQPIYDRQPFASWLFDTGDSTNDLDLVNLPFLDMGLESMFENNLIPPIDIDTPVSGTYSLDFTPAISGTDSDSNSCVSEDRRTTIVSLVQGYKQKKSSLPSNLDNFLRCTPDGDIPSLSSEFIKRCISAFWNHISPQMPFIHRPSFSPNNCHPLLLGVIISLGSYTVNRLNIIGNANEYIGLADLLAEYLRWDIFTNAAASPPAELWVQQALLLLELYEKMFSTIELHERAHIHHASTLTLLRRGNPLVGSSGSESPPGEPVSRLEDHSSPWINWAKSEAQNRVVFAAYLLDCSHSILFGHASILCPNEILLPLPCDELLWTAPSVEALQRTDQALRMYGLKSMSFLEGLKRTLHGHEVRTHPWARKILMYGLISVGWYLNHRESMLNSFDTPRVPSELERCREMLVKAFDVWELSFEEALTTNETLTGLPSRKIKGKRNFDDPRIIYFLANLSLHANVVDFQVLAGSKRFLSRKVSSRDKFHAAARIKEWAKTEAGRHSVLHAFRFLYAMLVSPQGPTDKSEFSTVAGEQEKTRRAITYSCRRDELNYGPWVLYLASLTIWAFTSALDPSSRLCMMGSGASDAPYASVADYLARYAQLDDVMQMQNLRLELGLLELLDMLQAGFADAESDIVREARHRLKDCRDMLCIIQGQ